MLNRKEYENLLKGLLEKKKKIEIQIEFVKSYLHPQTQLEFPEEVRSPLTAEQEPKKPPEQLENLTTSEAIRKVLLARGKPMRVPQIWNKMLEGGFRTESKYPKNIIYNIMDKSKKKFKKVKPPYWGLAEWYEKNEEEKETEVSTDETF